MFWEFLNWKNQYLETTNELQIAVSVSKLFPNPSSGKLIAQIDSGLNGQISIQVVNSLGQIVQENNIEVEAGMNITALDLENYNNGIYTAIFSNGNEKIVECVVKL